MATNTTLATKQFVERIREQHAAQQELRICNNDSVASARPSQGGRGRRPTSNTKNILAKPKQQDFGDGETSTIFGNYHHQNDTSTYRPQDNRAAPHDGADAPGNGDVAFPKKKLQKNAITIPLSVIFALDCLLIAAAFAAIIAYSSVQTGEIATDLIRDGIESSLMYAAAVITDPYDAIEELIVEYNARYFGTAIMHAAGDRRNRQ